MLVLGAFASAMVWNAYRPVLSPPMSVVSFFLGWFTGELALYWLLLGGGLIAWGIAVGPEGQQGALGLTLMCLSWVGLALHARGASTTGAVFEHALTEAFGERYAEHMATRRRDGLVEAASWKRMLRPFSPHRAEVEAIRGVPFKQVDGLELLLDIYRPRKAASNCPVVLQIHGGAWTQNLGDRTQQGLPLVNHLAAAGWMCVSTSYRLSPRATFPDHLIDVKSALVWIRAHAAEYGGDPSFVVVTGGSAGGHLTLLMALTANDPRYQEDHPGVDTSVQGAVPVYGVYDFFGAEGDDISPGMATLLRKSVMKLRRADHEEAYRRASPIEVIHADAPPMLIVHGVTDSLSPIAAGRRFVAKLRGVSKQPAAFVELPRAQHAFELFASLHTERHVQGVEHFVNFLHATRATRDSD